MARDADGYPTTALGRLRDALGEIRSGYRRAVYDGRVFGGFEPVGIADGHELRAVREFGTGKWYIERRNTYGVVVRRYDID